MITFTVQILFGGLIYLLLYNAAPLSCDIAQKNEMEPILVTIEPGGSTYPDNPHEGEEFGYVIEGAITIVIDNEKYQAKKGESFSIACDKPHYLENNSGRLAKVIWISSPPSF